MAYKRMFNLRITCLTPIRHIYNVEQNMSKLGTINYAPYCHYNTALYECRDAEVIFVNPNKMSYRLDKKLIDNCKDLKYIVTASTGTNHIDLEAAKAKGIEVISLTTQSDVIERISSTAEHALALTLALIRNIPKSFDDVKNGNWNYEPYVGRQMSELTFGVIGYGRLGRMYAKYAEAFGSAKIMCNDIKAHYKCMYERVELDTLLDRADVISLHVHLNDSSKHMVNDKFFEKVHNKPYLINTSRGDIVDEHAVVRALKSGTIAGYATDVLSDELGGNIKESPILQAAKEYNVIITPHIGGMTAEAQHIAYNSVLELLSKSLCAKQLQK